jgi:hypothetical protein
MFEHRDHVHTLLYRYEWCAGGSDAGVPPELALDHPFGGLVVTMIERAEGVSQADVHAWARDARQSTLILGFTPMPLPPGAPVTQPGLERLDRRTLMLGFSDAPPAQVWDAHREMCGSAAQRDGVGRVVWTSPFLPTVPGTDTYTDHLW